MLYGGRKGHKDYRCLIAIQEAAEEGLQRATKTLRGVTGFEVTSLKGKGENGGSPNTV